MGKAFTLYARDNADVIAIENFLSLWPTIHAEEKAARYPWKAEEIYQKVVNRLHEYENGRARIASTGLSDSGEYFVVVLTKNETVFRYGKARLRAGEDYDDYVAYGLAVSRAMGWKDLEQLMLEAVEHKEATE